MMVTLEEEQSNSKNHNLLSQILLLEVFVQLGYFCGVFYVCHSRLTFDSVVGINWTFENPY